MTKVNMPKKFKTDDIVALEKVFKKDFMNKVYLIQTIGVSSTNTIDKWVSRGYVPAMRRRAVLNFIKRKMR